jgi:hypothetical protein
MHWSITVRSPSFTEEEEEKEEEEDEDVSDSKVIPSINIVSLSTSPSAISRTPPRTRVPRFEKSDTGR